jgi:integrase
VGRLSQNMKLRVPYLWQDTDRHGNVRLYVAVPGRHKVRVREEPETPEFWAVYNAAVSGGLLSEDGRVVKSLAKAALGSLRSLVEGYYNSSDFRALAAGTQTVRRGILDNICFEFGDKPFARMESRHVRQIRDAKTDFPESANGRIKALRQVFKWATDDTVGLAKNNPAANVPYLSPNNPDGFHSWTIEEVAQYVAKHPVGAKAHLALCIFLYAGVRRSDGAKLGPQMERDGWLEFTETKGSNRKPKRRQIPILPPLRAAIDACPSGHLTYLVTTFGKPFTSNGLGNRFKKWCVEAGLPHCSAHGLRKAGATFAVENGATEHQLMAIYQWESPKQAALYTRQANRKLLTGAAMHLIQPRVDEQESNEILPLSEGVASSGSKLGKKA